MQRNHSNHVVPDGDEAASPWALVAGGMALAVVGALFLLGDDRPAGALVLGSLFLLLAGVLLMVGCVAAGVEIGVRRARASDRSRDRAQA